jgi:HSP20 family protein
MTMELMRRTNRPTWPTAPFDLDRWMDPFFNRLWPDRGRWPTEEYIPRVDIREEDGKYILTAELPGMKKDDISVSVDQGQVTISGKKEAEHEEKERNYYLKETSYGSFSRSFRLPEAVDESKAEAKYENGVLEVVLPQKEAAERKRIEIH